MRNVNGHREQYVRAIINTIKIILVSLSMVALIKLAQYIPSGDINYAHWLLVVMSLAIVTASFIDVSMESDALPADFAMLPAFLLGIVGVVEVGRALWASAPEASVSDMVYIIGLTIHLPILTGNDSEMDRFTVPDFYKRTYPRETRYFTHLCFNTVPYVIGYFGFLYAMRTYNTEGAWAFVWIFLCTGFTFIFIDEYLRHKKYWSFFWVNSPLRSHYAMKAQLRK